MGFDKRLACFYHAIIMLTLLPHPIAIAAAQGVRSNHVVQIHGG